MSVHIRDCFAWFLSTTVNLNKTRLDRLQSAFSSIQTYVTPPGGFADAVHSQGSFAQGTIIHPGTDGTFDADALVEVEYDGALEPRAYYDRIFDEMNASAVWGDKVERRKRHCVRIDYAGDFHLDLVPYVLVGEHPHIVDRHDGPEDANGQKVGKLIRTNPLGYIEWIKEMDELANGRLIETIRLFKYLRDQQSSYEIPSIILSTLLGARAGSIDARLQPEAFNDLPSAFAFIARLLKKYLENNAFWMPQIEDPSLLGTTFNHRWPEAEYHKFRERMLRKTDEIIAADEETDHNSAVEKWQIVFGDRFVEPAADDVIELANRAAADRAPGEMFPNELFRIAPRPEHLSIETEITKAHTTIRKRVARHASPLGKGNNLRFVASQPLTVAEPYEVHWKVRNRGTEAGSSRQLRGEIVRSRGLTPLEHTESTKYTGSHYVEAFVVKDGEVMAYGHSDVPIGS